MLIHLNTQEYSELNCTLALSLFYTLMSNSGIPVKLIDRLKAKNNVNIS
jgi:hypothetical protein